MFLPTMHTRKQFFITQSAKDFFSSSSVRGFYRLENASGNALPEAAIGSVKRTFSIFTSCRLAGYFFVGICFPCSVLNGAITRASCVISLDQFGKYVPWSDAIRKLNKKYTYVYRYRILEIMFNSYLIW